MDGIEVYNSGNGEEIWNRRAEWYADEFGFRKTAGSDNHHLSAASERLAGVFSEVKRLTNIKANTASCGMI